MEPYMLSPLVVPLQRLVLVATQKSLKKVKEICKHDHRPWPHGAHQVSLQDSELQLLPLKTELPGWETSLIHQKANN